MSSSAAATTAGSAELQERLHTLINNLYHTTELVKNWEDSENASDHVQTTTKLIASLQEVLQSVKDVETKVLKGDGTEGDKKIIQELKDSPVPLDLLELMDYGGGINPDVFARGLLQTALRQLAGLKRRKLALGLLGAAVSDGMKRRDKEQNQNGDDNAGHGEGNNKGKRKRSVEGNNNNDDEAEAQPPVKKRA